MAWIKRNLFFVLSIAAGLGLTVYSIILFAGDYNASTDVNKEYQDTVVQIGELEKKVPFPSDENIQHAKDDQSQVKEFVDDLRNSFKAFPTPPKEDEKGFSAYLEDTIADLKTQATNAEVGVPADFAFGFTDKRGKVNFAQDDIPKWMQQLAEIKAICDILYRARINSLVSFRRVAISAADQFQNANDQLQAGITPTPLGTLTPYKIEFKSFTGELAAVMEGLAHSSNCFIVKNVVVGLAGPRVMDQSVAAPQANTANPATLSAAQEVMPAPPASIAGDRAAMAAYVQRWQVAHDRRVAREADAAAKAVARPSSAAPVTVEREQLLYITLSVDVIKFK